MILFTILLAALIIFSVFKVLSISAGGVIFIILFGDVIVCAIIIFFVFKKLIRGKRNRK